MNRTRDRSGRVLHALRGLFASRPGVLRGPALRINRAQLTTLLVFLIALDLALATVALAFPGRWFQIMHGLPYDDPAGLLRRTGALWAAFVVLQSLALVRWQAQPYWLALIAGVRLTELFSDWTTIVAARQVTTLGTLGLVISPPCNLVFGWVLISTYKRLQAGPLDQGSLWTWPWS